GIYGAGLLSYKFMNMNKNIQRFAIAILALISLGLTSKSAIQFIDATKSAGISTVTYTGGTEKNHILESTGNGVLVLDYDGDGFQDIYFISAYRFPKRGQTEPHPNALYHNNGNGTFTDVTKQAKVAAAVYGQGGC